MNNDVHYTNTMLEFEKLTTKLDKLEKELAEFKELVFPLQVITNEFTPELVGSHQQWINSPVRRILIGETDEH